MSYSFRNKILIDPDVSITSEIPKDMAAVLHRVEPDGPVVMISPDFGGRLVLQGENFPSPEAAIEAGKIWRQHLLVALARVGIGANLGSDGEAWFPEAFERAAAEGKEGVAVTDVGLIVHETGANIVLGQNAPKSPWEARPSVFSTRVEAEKCPLESLVDGPLMAVSGREYTLSERQSLAYNLFHDSFFETNPETKNVTLVTAVEALIIQSPRSAQVVSALDALKEKVSDYMDLNAPDKETVLNALGNVKRQSINEAGQQLAHQLLKQPYDHLPPDKFFRRSYVDRCNLVHGSTDRPTTNLLRVRNPILATFVADLLDASVFGPRI